MLISGRVSNIESKKYVFGHGPCRCKLKVEYMLDLFEEKKNVHLLLMHDTDVPPKNMIIAGKKRKCLKSYQGHVAF